MHTRMRTFLAASALLALALPTLAQKPGAAPTRQGGPPAAGGPGGPGGGGRPGQGRGGRRGVPLAILPVSVLDMLTPLKSDQKAKITTIETKLQADMKTATRESRGPMMTKANDDVKAILTPAQQGDVQKSLPTLMMISQSRAIPFGAMGDVKLTKDQMSKISGFASAAASQLQGVQGQERQTKMQQIGPALKTQIDGVLTKSQKDAIAKYEAAHPRPQRGGPGGPGGPGGFGGPGGGGGRPGGAPPPPGGARPGGK